MPGQRLCLTSAHWWQDTPAEICCPHNPCQRHRPTCASWLGGEGRAVWVAYRLKKSSVGCHSAISSYTSCTTCRQNGVHMRAHLLRAAHCITALAALNGRTPLRCHTSLQKSANGGKGSIHSTAGAQPPAHRLLGVGRPRVVVQLQPVVQLQRRLADVLLCRRRSGGGGWGIRARGTSGRCVSWGGGAGGMQEQACGKHCRWCRPDRLEQQQHRLKEPAHGTAQTRQQQASPGSAQ